MGATPEPIFDWKIDTPIDQIVCEAIGAASMCWEHLDQTGEFDSGRAIRIKDELMAMLRAKQWAEEAP